MVVCEMQADAKLIKARLQAVHPSAVSYQVDSLLSVADACTACTTGLYELNVVWRRQGPCMRSPRKHVCLQHASVTHSVQLPQPKATALHT
jgi:hypothetical protein